MNEKKNALLSVKLKVLSFISIVMVLYIHTYYTEGEHLSTLGAIETLIGQRLCLIAVPLFYAISGYLFFLKMPDGMRSIGNKLRKRVRTLFVPYIIANVLTFLFYILLNLITLASPSIDAVVNFKVLDVVHEGIWKTFSLVFIDPPIAFQLWFVRDLMVVMILSPLVYMVLRVMCKCKFFMLPIIVIVLLYILIDNHIVVAFAWFSLGGLFAMHPSIFVTKRFPSWTGYSLVVTVLMIMIVTISYDAPVQLNKLIPVLGIPMMWIMFDQLTPPDSIKLLKSKIITGLFPYTFFIYLSHEPLLNTFKKLPLLLSRSEWVFIVCYLSVPIIYVLFACVVGRWLKKHFPVPYSIYTGGR